MTKKPSERRGSGMRRASFALCLFWFSLASHGVQAQTVDAQGSVDAESISTAIRQIASGTSLTLAGANGTALDLERIKDFYGRRDFHAAWVVPGGPDAAAAALRAGLIAAPQEGLAVAPFHGPTIDGLWAATSAQGLAELDVLLTDAAIRYASAMAEGEVAPDAVDPDWHIPVPMIDSVGLAEGIADARDPAAALAALEPPQAAYHKLKTALPIYRALAEAGGWPQIPEGEKLSPGMTDPRVAILRVRLAIENAALAGRPIPKPGEVKPASGRNPAHFDEALEHELEAFQTRNGQDADGVLGKRTTFDLNVTADDRARQIEANMERWRWMPRAFEPRYVLVNTAGFELALVDQGAPTLTSKVIVGKSDTQTPSLKATIRAVLVNPPWVVPVSIAKKEILPHLREDASYLASKNMRLFDGYSADAEEVDPESIDWESVRGFPYQIRQDPGPWNALGPLKLVMNNPYDVYLHGTPERKLFAKANRNFSHGCVRVDQVMDLAVALLGPDWDADRVQALIDGGETKAYALPSPVAIYLAYLTAWVDDAGVMQFREDPYGRDRNLMGAMGNREGRPNAIAGSGATGVAVQ